MHQPAQKGPRGHDHSASAKLQIEVGTTPQHPARLEDKPGDGRLKHVQVGLQLQRVLEPKLIGLLIALRSRRLDGGPLRLVQQSKLDAGDIGVDRHFAAQGVDLPHHLSLGLSANRGVAAHLRDGVDVAGQEQGRSAHP
jgi:hypothetical protein